MARIITFSIDSDFANVALAAAALRGVCGLVPLDGEPPEELELAVVEALNNIIKHGYAGRSSLPVVMMVELRPDRVVVRLSDQGARIPGHLLEEARSGVFTVDLDHLEDLPEGGMGLRLMLGSVDVASYASEGGTNHLTLEKVFAA